MPKPPITRISTLEIYNPNYQGPDDLAPADLPEFIVPQVTTDQADALPNLQDGMIVYDVTDDAFKFRQAGAWVLLGGGAGTITEVIAGTGLEGGGDAGDVTLSITATGVAANTYTFNDATAGNVESITVNAQGQITAIALAA